MLIPYEKLDKWIPEGKFNGVVHGGAHAYEEYNFYEGRNTGRVYWFEADPQTVKKYAHLVSPADVVYEGALWSESGLELNFNRANNDQSSSLLDLKTHVSAHPEVHFVDSFTVPTLTLDELVHRAPVAGQPTLGNVEFMNLDLQGAELEALKGARDLLGSSVNYVYTEVNVDELYEGCGRLGQVDHFLNEFGFVRRETVLTHFGWGDAFYVKHTPKWH